MSWLSTGRLNDEQKSQADELMGCRCGEREEIRLRKEREREEERERKMN